MKINKAQLQTECLNALKMQRDRLTYTNRTPLPVQLTEDDLTFKRNTLIDNYNAIVKERSLLDSQIQSGTLNNHSENNVYSNNKKEFYGPVSDNVNISRYVNVNGVFDIKRLPQTNVREVLKIKEKTLSLYEVSLSETISKVHLCVGSIRDSNSNRIGSGTLISEDLMLIARHSIEGRNLATTKLKASFKNIKQASKHSSMSHYEIEYVVESDSELDFAIVKLKGSPGKELGFMKFEKDRGVYSEPALLHYPLDKPLQVSVHTYKETQYKLNILQTYHDSDYASSGGPYIDPKGYLVAMHIGCEFGQNTMNLPRYAIPIKEIISQHPHGILAKLSTQILSQKQVYKSLTQSFYLAPIKRHFILDEEGTGYYKYKKANEIPHVHCYAGGFHVKLKNQKDRHNIVQKGKLYKEKLKLALKFCKDKNNFKLRDCIMKELDKYFGSNTAEVKEVLNELNILTPVINDDIPDDFPSMKAMWDHVKKIEINKLRKLN